MGVCRSVGGTVMVSVNLVNSTELQRQGPPHTPYIAIISNSIITLMIGALKEEIHARQ